MNKKKYLKLIPNDIDDFNSLTRDIRELNVAKELGLDVIVIIKGENKNNLSYSYDFNIHQISTRPLGEKFPKFLNRFISLIQWIKKAKSFKADLISGHDLICLYIGYFSRNKNSKLIYDSHEYTIENTNIHSRLKKNIIKAAERFIIKKCDLIIEVSDLIASEIKQIYNLSVSPLSIRNIPSLWNIDYNECKKVNKEYRSYFNLYDHDTFIIMYHGRIAQNRGIEQL